MEPEEVYVLEADQKMQLGLLPCHPAQSHWIQLAVAFLLVEPEEVDLLAVDQRMQLGLLPCHPAQPHRI
jgi:hypothetical protein